MFVCLVMVLLKHGVQHLLLLLLMLPSPAVPPSTLCTKEAYLMVDRISWMKGRLLLGSSSGFSCLTCSMLRRGVSMRGPLPLMTSNSTPSAGRGVKMSLKKMMPSVLNARHGWSDSSMAISGVSDRILKGYLSEYSLKAAMYLPACLMSHTGVRSTSGQCRLNVRV